MDASENCVSDRLAGSVSSYGGVGLAAVLAPPSPAKSAALIGFAAQLLLNAIWSPVFFGRHDLLGGLVIISLLLVTLTFTIVMSFQVDWRPGALLVPYIVWICF